MSKKPNKIKPQASHNTELSDANRTGQAATPLKLAALERCKVSKVKIDGVIPGNYFSDAIIECYKVYKSGCFIATVMVTQAVNERLLKFIAEKSGVMGRKKKKITLPRLVDLKTSPLLRVHPHECVAAFKKIYDSHRNDVHHINPNISEVKFPEQAKENIECLGLIEREIFALRPTDNPGQLEPKHPQYWGEIGEDGTIPVMLRYPRVRKGAKS